MTLTASGLRAAADRLIAAAAEPQQCDPVRDILGETGIASAYAVQRPLTEEPLALRDAVETGLRLADALKTARRVGVLYRNVNPPGRRGKVSLRR